MPSVSEIWEKGFIDIGNIYVDAYFKGVFTMEKMAAAQVYRSVIIEVYKVLVLRGDLIRLEQLEQETKNEIWEYCKQFIEPLPTHERIKFCKCYWALSCLAQKRNV